MSWGGGGGAEGEGIIDEKHVLGVFNYMSQGGGRVRE